MSTKNDYNPVFAQLRDGKFSGEATKSGIPMDFVTGKVTSDDKKKYASEYLVPELDNVIGQENVEKLAEWLNRPDVYNSGYTNIFRPLRTAWAKAHKPAKDETKANDSTDATIKALQEQIKAMSEVLSKLSV